MLAAAASIVYGKNKYAVFNSICILYNRVCQLLLKNDMLIFYRTQHFMKNGRKTGDFTEAKRNVQRVCMYMLVSVKEKIIR